MKKLVLLTAMIGCYIAANENISFRVARAKARLEKEAITDSEKRFFLAGFMVFSRLAEVCKENPPTHPEEIEGCRKMQAAHRELTAEFIEYMLNFEQQELGLPSPNA